MTRSMTMQEPHDGAGSHGTDQHERVRARYSDFARHYDRSFRRYTTCSTHIILSALRAVPEPRRVLDACCGTGVVTAALAQRFEKAEVIGVDLSPDMLQRARGHLDSLAPRVRLAEAPAERLPAATGSIDLLVCANALHLVPEPQEALREFARVLAPGGLAVILDWTLDAPAMRVLVTWLNATQRTQRRVYRMRSLEAALSGAHLRVEALSRVRIPPAWGLMLARARKPST